MFARDKGTQRGYRLRSKRTWPRVADCNFPTPWAASGDDQIILHLGPYALLILPEARDTCHLLQVTTGGEGVGSRLCGEPSREQTNNEAVFCRDRPMIGAIPALPGRRQKHSPLKSKTKAYTVKRSKGTCAAAEQYSATLSETFSFKFLPRCCPIARRRIIGLN